MSRIIRSWSLGNWPPDAPWKVPHAPPGLVEREEDLERQAEDLYRDFAAFTSSRERAHTLAWLHWHDEHGWPDDPGYRERLEAKR